MRNAICILSLIFAMTAHGADGDKTEEQEKKHAEEPIPAATLAVTHHQLRIGDHRGDVVLRAALPYGGQVRTDVSPSPFKSVTAKAGKLPFEQLPCFFHGER